MRRKTNAVWGEAEQRWVSDAEVAEVPFTAFTGRRTADHLSAQLIVRRVKRLNPTANDSTGLPTGVAGRDPPVALPPVPAGGHQAGAVGAAGSAVHQ